MTICPREVMENVISHSFTDANLLRDNFDISRVIYKETQ